MAERGERLPVDVRIALAFRMAGDEGDSLRQIAMGERHSGGGGAADCRSDPGRCESGDAGGFKRVQLFAAATENKRVAALETNDDFAGARIVDEAAFDFVLRNR